MEDITLHSESDKHSALGLSNYLHDLSVIKIVKKQSTQSKIGNRDAFKIMKTTNHASKYEVKSTPLNAST